MSNLLAQEQPRLQEPVIQQGTHDDYPPAHILVVDDEIPNIELVSSLLSSRTNYLISAAHGGHEAMQKIEESIFDHAPTIDLVLLDQKMPGMSGSEVLRYIRSHSRLNHMRIVMLTSNDDKEEVAKALQEGADDYVIKPYHQQELLARIKTNLRTQQLQKELEQQGRQLARLNTVSNNLSSTTATRDIFPEITRGIRELIQCDVAVFYLQKSHTQELECRFLDTNNSDLKASDFPTIPLGTGVMSRVFESRVCHCIKDARSDARFMSDIDAPTGYEVKNVIAAPVYLRGHPTGVIAAFNKQLTPFRDADVDLFVSFANTASQSLENSFNYDQIKVKQKDLQESTRTLQNLIDGILHPIYTINSKWELVSINQAKADQQEGGKPDLLGKRCYEAFYDRKTPCDHCQMAQLKQVEGDARRWTYRWVNKDYSPQEWDVSAFSLRTKKENQAKAVIVWQDRTEERQMENSLHQASKLAAIGQLAAGVAHEINNPLTVITTGAEMLKEIVPKDNHEDYELVEWISNASDRATKVVRGLLDFARQSRFDFAEGQLKNSINSSIELIAYQLKKANIEVVLSFPADLPPIVASWEHLKTVWLNIMLNARDALETLDQKRRIKVLAHLSPNSDYVQLVFNDNGTGMSEEQSAHIFEPFFTTKDPGKGTGLGLATSHRIIDRHGGEISVMSTLGEGTSFIIRLPIGERPASS